MESDTGIRRSFVQCHFPPQDCKQGGDAATASSPLTSRGQGGGCSWEIGRQRPLLGWEVQGLEGRRVQRGTGRIRQDKNRVIFVLFCCFFKRRLRLKKTNQKMLLETLVVLNIAMGKASSMKM